MKIGIATFHRAQNYGAVLQAFALQKVIEDLGHKAEFIDFQYNFELSRRAQSSSRSSCLINIFIWARRKILEIPFWKFRRDHLNCTSKTYYSISALNESIKDQYDAVICGSDQIWNPDHTKNEDDEKFSWLQFSDINIKRISYAGSFGVSSIPDELKDRWGEYIRIFHAISVREDSALKIIAEMTPAEAFWVPDPTQLLSSTEYHSLFSRDLISKNNLLVFTLGNYKLKRVGQQIAQAMQIKNSFICPTSLKWFVGGGYIGPVRWLQEISASKYIVTDSYHAVSFAVVFSRPFVVVLKPATANSRNSRLESLLGKIGLLSRISHSDDPAAIQKILTQPINWEDVHQSQVKFATEGISFLKNALSCGHSNE